MREAGHLLERRIVCYQVPAFEIALARLGDAALRNRPVAIAPSGPRAVLQEISSEAHGDGVTVDMAVTVARRLCPGLRILHSDERRIKTGQQQLLTVVQRYAPLWEVSRPGHLLLDLTGTKRLFGPALDTGVKIEQELAQRYGLPGVIGVGTNPLVAELAASMVRPIQAYDVWPGAEAWFVSPLPITQLPVDHDLDARHIRQRLHDLHLQTFGDLAALPFPALELAFPRHAQQFAQWACGQDPSLLRTTCQQPAIVCERVLSPDAMNDAVVEGHLYGLLEEVCSALRRQQRACRTFTVIVHYADRRCVQRRGQGKRSVCWEVDAWPVVRGLLHKAWQRRVRLRVLILAANHLEPIVEQLALFPADTPESRQDQRQRRLSIALDCLKARFGASVISWGS
jgi:DNA polymerase-4